MVEFGCRQTDAPAQEHASVVGHVVVVNAVGGFREELHPMIRALLSAVLRVSEQQLSYAVRLLK